MKISFSTSIFLLQVVGLFSYSYGLEETDPKVASFSQSLRRGLAGGTCSGSPSISDCSSLNQGNCGNYHGCAWTSQYGNKCWGSPLSCDTFNKPGHGESWCTGQPGCSWSSDGSSFISGGSSGCFSGDNEVEVLMNAKVTTKAMKDLRVGDRVRTGMNSFEPVYAFGHYDAVNSLDYIKLFAGQSSIELSKEHLVYANGKAVRADTVKVGDILSNENGNPAQVTKISKIRNKKGMYAPLTAGGTIVLNGGDSGSGILASTYVAIQSEATSSTEEIKVHGIALPFVNQNTGIHLAISPLRIACTMTGSLGICKGDYDLNGINPYVAWGMDMVAWVEQQAAVVQILVVYGAITAFLALNVFENVLMGTGPLAFRLVTLLVFGAFVSIHARNGNPKKKVA